MKKMIKTFALLMAISVSVAACKFSSDSPKDVNDSIPDSASLVTPVDTTLAPIDSSKVDSLKTL